MEKARIYKPNKNAMQSGRAKSKIWVLEYENRSAKGPDPLMGWTQSDGTLDQIRLKFSTLEEATAYAEKAGLYYKVEPERVRSLKPKNYSDNFRYIPPEEGESA